MFPKDQFLFLLSLCLTRYLDALDRLATTETLMAEIVGSDRNGKSEPSESSIWQESKSEPSGSNESESKLSRCEESSFELSVSDKSKYEPSGSDESKSELCGCDESKQLSGRMRLLHWASPHHSCTVHTSFKEIKSLSLGFFSLPSFL